MGDNKPRNFSFLTFGKKFLEETLNLQTPKLSDEQYLSRVLISERVLHLLKSLKSLWHQDVTNKRNGSSRGRLVIRFDFTNAALKNSIVDLCIKHSYSPIEVIDNINILNISNNKYSKSVFLIDTTSNLLISDAYSVTTVNGFQSILNTFVDIALLCNSSMVRIPLDFFGVMKRDNLHEYLNNFQSVFTREYDFRDQGWAQLVSDIKLTDGEGIVFRNLCVKRLPCTTYVNEQNVSNVLSLGGCKTIEYPAILLNGDELYVQNLLIQKFGCLHSSSNKWAVYRVHLKIDIFIPNSKCVEFINVLKSMGYLNCAINEECTFDMFSYDALHLPLEGVSTDYDSIFWRVLPPHPNDFLANRFVLGLIRSFPLNFKVIIKYPIYYDLNVNRFAIVNFIQLPSRLYLISNKGNGKSTLLRQFQDQSMYTIDSDSCGRILNLIFTRYPCTNTEKRFSYTNHLVEICKQYYSYSPEVREDIINLYNLESEYIIAQWLQSIDLINISGLYKLFKSQLRLMIQKLGARMDEIWRHYGLDFDKIHQGIIEVFNRAYINGEIYIKDDSGQQLIKELRHIVIMSHNLSELATIEHGKIIRLLSTHDEASIMVLRNFKKYGGIDVNRLEHLKGIFTDLLLFHYYEAVDSPGVPVMDYAVLRNLLEPH